MAILKAPLLSLRASNQLGKAIAYRSMRRNNVACAYAQPSDPQSPTQLIQRQKIKRTVEFWQDVSTAGQVNEGWTRYAKYLRKPWSAYQAMMHFYGDNPLTGNQFGVWRIQSESWIPHMYCRFWFKNLNTQGGFTGNTQMRFYAGATPLSLVYQRNFVVYSDGSSNISDTSITSGPVFWQYTLQTGEPITGIIEFQP